MKLKKVVMNHRTLGHGGELCKSLIFLSLLSILKNEEKKELFQINLKCAV